jgi:hypothetical protein
MSVRYCTPIALAAALMLSACSPAVGDGASPATDMPAATAAMAAVAATPAAAPRPDADHPVVVELYQSQGCSSCPPANANVNQLAQRHDVLALSFAVTYWDDLGWRDRFARPAFTDRQWDYARANRRAQVWTPQTVVNGRAATVTGRHRDELDALIARAGRPSGGPAIGVADRQVTLGRGAARSPATVWLVRYDPREQAVPIAAGENDGRTLPHRNIVTRLERIGEWTGAQETLTIAASPNPVWHSAVLVQAGSGGAIIAARRL